MSPGAKLAPFALGRGVFPVERGSNADTRNGGVEGDFQATEDDAERNPVFIAIILTVLAAGSYFFERWLDQLHPTAPAPITFTSGRKSVTLRVEEILYVESNDDATVVYATGGRSFRNITPFPAGKRFSSPISRKYRETVQGLYS